MEKKKGCLSVTKYFLFVFNLFFFVLGGLLLSFGLWILFDKSSFSAVIGDNSTLKVWSYLFSGVGTFTMLLGFLGCLGSLKEIKCLLGFYFGFLLLLFATQITAGVLVYTQRNTLKAAAGDYVREIIKTYDSTTISDTEESWDFVQSKFKCCGWTGLDDWQSLNEQQKRFRNVTLDMYPCSCLNMSAITPSGNISTNATRDTKGILSGFCEASSKQVVPVYRVGCMNSVQAWLSSNIILIVGVCLGVALLELFVMTLSMCLCRNLDQDYDKLSRY
ncbi:CD82 antigen-like isoform X2 [Ambystoma mexicanum]|uniref:CD82 antigen-like isoform X2 n=1 Tax=Ambystoma mexicanum TaxID=8296 RepID=UPI0037E93333